MANLPPSRHERRAIPRWPRPSPPWTSRDGPSGTYGRYRRHATLENPGQQEGGASWIGPWKSSSSRYRRRRRVVHRPPQRGSQQRDGRGDHERDGGRRLPAGRPGPRGMATGGCGNAEVRGNHSGHAGDCLRKRASARTAVTSATCSPRTVSTSSDWQVARDFAVQPTASMNHHSLLDAAQRLMPASVAYWSMALSSSSANARLSSAATLSSSWATLLAPMTSEVIRVSRSRSSSIQRFTIEYDG